MIQFRELFARLFRRTPVQVELGGFRYRAFLSYRTADQNAAKRLHQALERYRVPRELVGKPGELGTVPPAVGRLFRDRDEVRTAEDVETIIAQELSKAQQLIVFCTPRAAEPEAWVGREIEIFRERRPDGRIHAVIGDGEPPGCFPRQLLHATPNGKLRQPLAADLRPRKKGGQDGESRAIVKIVAGLIGVSFDDLWKREQRRARRRLAALGIGIAVFTGFAGVAGFWMNSRTEALKAAAQNTVARNYWQQARGVAQSDPLLSLHLMTEAAATATDPRLRNAVLLDRAQGLNATRLISAWDAFAGAGSFAVAVLDDGKAAVIWSNQGLKRFDLAAAAAPAQDLVAPGLYKAARFNASGTRIVLWTEGAEGGEAEIGDTATGRITSSRVKHGARIDRAGFSPDDRAFYTADNLGNVRVWDNDGKPLGQTGTKDDNEKAELERVTLSSGGKLGLIVTRHREQLYESTYYVTTLWDLDSRKVLATHDPIKTDPGRAVGTDGIFSRDGRLLLTWKDQSAWILNTQDGATRKLEMLHPGEKVQGAVFDDSEQRVVTWTGSVIRIWDVAADREPLQPRKLDFEEGVVSGLTIDKEHNTISAWAENGTVRVWSLKDGISLGPPIRHHATLDGQRETWSEPDHGPVVVQMSKSGNSLLSWINDASVRIWNPRTGLQISPAMSHRGLVAGAVFTTDDSRVLSWSADGTLRLWSIETPTVRPTRRLLTAASGADGFVSGSAVNEDPDGLLTWRDDGTVTIWDLAKSAPVIAPVTLPEAAAVLFSGRKADKGFGRKNKGGPRVAFNRQGTRLVVYGGPESTFVARLWDGENGRALAELGNPQHVTFNREGTFFATWDTSGALTLRRSSDGQATAAEVNLLTKHKNNPVKRIQDVVVNSTGDLLAVVYSDDGDGDPAVRVWSMEQERYIGSEVDPVSAVQFNSRGDRLALWRDIMRGGDSHPKPSAVLVDATSGRVISDRKISMEDWHSGKLFDRSGAWLFGSTGVWDATTGESIRHDVRGGLSDTTGKYVVLLAGSGKAELVDATSHRTTSVLDHGQVLKKTLLRGSTVLTIGDNIMKLWSLESGQQIGSQMPLEDHEDVDGFFVPASGAGVLTWDNGSGAARLREPKSGHQVGATMRHGSQIDGAVLSGELGLIVTWDSGSIKLWDDLLCELINFRLGQSNEGADGAFFVPGQSRLLMWRKDAGSEWDLSEFLRPGAGFLRTQAAALTGAEYDSNARRVRALTTERWKTRMEQYLKQ
jgi:WD40 repeat protein